MHEEKLGEMGEDPSVSSPIGYILVSFSFYYDIIAWKILCNKPYQHEEQTLLSSVRLFMWALRILPRDAPT